MKKKIIVFLCLCCSLTLSAQEVIASQGTSYSNANGSVDFTLGEAVISTLTSPSNIVTQGFHQTNLMILAADDFDLGLQARVFPNPTQDLLQVDIQEFDGLQYKLFDLQGRQLHNEKIDQRNSTISLSNYATGVYLFVVLNENNQKLKTYRIIKN